MLEAYPEVSPKKIVHAIRELKKLIVEDININNRQKICLLYNTKAGMNIHERVVTHILKTFTNKFRVNYIIDGVTLSRRT